MLAINGLVEHKSIHGLIYAAYVLTVGEGYREVSSGVNGRMMGSARGPVSVLVGSSSDLAKMDRCSETILNTRDLKCLFVTGVVAKLIFSMSD